MALNSSLAESTSLLMTIISSFVVVAVHLLLMAVTFCFKDLSSPSDLESAFTINFSIDSLRASKSFFVVFSSCRSAIPIFKCCKSLLTEASSAAVFDWKSLSFTSFTAAFNASNSSCVFPSELRSSVSIDSFKAVSSSLVREESTKLFNCSFSKSTSDWRSRSSSAVFTLRSAIWSLSTDFLIDARLLLPTDLSSSRVLAKCFFRDEMSSFA